MTRSGNERTPDAEVSGSPASPGSTGEASQELRCSRRLHAMVVEDGAIEIHCRSCSHHRVTVFHRYHWDGRTGEWVRMPDRLEAG